MGNLLSQDIFYAYELQESTLFAGEPKEFLLGLKIPFWIFQVKGIDLLAHPQFFSFWAWAGGAVRGTFIHSEQGIRSPRIEIDRTRNGRDSSPSLNGRKAGPQRPCLFP